ncbi:26S proteasome non-ATPase regulatory subunit 7 [Heterostelium album PN500]|uniref:26S proteasome non-ATPase regulatory subunit 7 n=1 Tax=Heterostelium pallidum (strain ATCC 26659 / Pp 5 / PN500) TaxID=670386 RepID=D3BQZ8_HETP5|nr:26S proteasome non-ATPase regulatory subunit 7 [Heterostelium album PN500]EFA76184.1 26S proteasome non-ATPase regulatory subunit 7 [Heterostelium album PN500]|eukprot:XP_020428317.1 26S proteasome non-ATPase regulatory subunit 7 [Heterostelium album PN500]
MSTFPNSTVVHPTVLLSVVDHYNRVAKDTNKRVVGALLGANNKGVIDISNCYGVPFEEDDANPNIWFLDHNFHENMFAMFKKINARENVVGWYSTGPKIRPSDQDINELFRRYTPNPVLVIIDVAPKELGIPTKSYVTVEEVNKETSESTMRFQHIPSSIDAVEAEEICIEHLLRDVKDSSISSLTNQIVDKKISLKHLANNLQEMTTYLDYVVAEKLPLNQQIIGFIQDIINLSPNLNVGELAKSFSVEMNDTVSVIYISSLIRSIIALHNLILNKIENRDAEKKADQIANQPAPSSKDTATTTTTDSKDKPKENSK